MNRRDTVLAILALAASPLGVEAQQVSKVWRVGFLSPLTANHDRSWRAALHQGLQGLGYVEGRNFVLEQRHSGGQFERLPALASELVSLKLDVLVVHGSATAYAKELSSALPIIMVAHPDPVGVGLVESLQRPGGNVTGLSDLHSELGPKRMQLLKELIPSISRVGVVWNPAIDALRSQLKDAQNAGRMLNLAVIPIKVQGPSDFDAAFAAARKERVQAINVLGVAVNIHGRRFAELAAKNRMPTIVTTRRATTEDGFLISYGADFADLYRRAATYVDKILKGAKPGDLAVEQPTKFELVINVKTANRLGLTIPQSILVRADEVIQ